MVKDVMVFTPVLRLESETVRSLFAQEFEGAVSFLMQRDNPSGNPYADHLHQYQRGREMFLAGTYDAMLIVESDIILPVDALKRLAALDCDVAYGCYVYRDGRVVNLLEEYAPDGGPGPKKVKIQMPGQGTRANPGESLSVRHLWKAAQKLGVIEVSGSGLGCVLIRREVIQKVPFEEKYTRNNQGFFDFPWTCAVHEAGYRMMADTEVQCGHVDRDGTELWLARSLRGEKKP